MVSAIPHKINWAMHQLFWRWLESWLFSAIYLTSIMCICGTSIICQMSVLNCYHVYPLREVPAWLRRVQTCMPCLLSRSHKSRKIDVLPYTGENGDHGKDALKHKKQTVQLTHRNGKGADTESSRTEENVTLPGMDVITLKMKANDEDEKLRLQWKNIARFFDRLLFTIFGIIHILMILVIFIIIPYA